MSDLRTRPPVSVGIDIGGTFTDVVCDFGDGTLKVMKVPSDAQDPSRAVLGAIARMGEDWGVAPDAVGMLAHGTTVATNAVIERAGARLGIITTDGFRDILEIGRQGREEIYDTVLRVQTPVFLAPRARRLTVKERIAADGSIVVPLDEAAVVAAADRLVADGCEAIAVVFLFSFANPAHEERAAALIAGRHPDVALSISSAVDPTFREYERTTTTSFDAYMKPVLDRYLSRMETSLAEAGVSAPFQIIQSRGGLCSATVARQKPVRLFLSGPAAGVVAGVEIGRSAGRGDLITIDMGGTSSDISLVRGGTPLVRTEGRIERFPVRVPMMDIHAIGAGGGSIAMLDGAGGLVVGPASAGSDPGPACYGRGGTRPTVTDASVLLGYLGLDRLAGGTLTIDPAPAREAVRRDIAEPLGLSVDDAALGIHRVVNAQMAEGIRLVSIERGHDPRTFSLVAMGGAAGLHAAALAEALGITEILLPASPGVASALGLLSAPVEHEVLRATPMRLAEFSAETVRSVLAELDIEAAALIALDGVAPEDAEVRHAADVCFVGQAYTITIPLDAVDEGTAARLYATFLEAHRTLYGHAAEAPVRIVNLRTTHRFDAGRRPGTAEVGAARPATVRPVVLTVGGGRVDAAVVDRASLAPGDTLDGPAIVEQADSTTLVPAGWQAEVLAAGTMTLRHVTEETPR